MRKTGAENEAGEGNYQRSDQIAYRLCISADWGRPHWHGHGSYTENKAQEIQKGSCPEYRFGLNFEAEPSLYYPLNLRHNQGEKKLIDVDANLNLNSN
jgi:hypothetical protein